MKFKNIIVVLFLFFVVFSCRKKCVKEDIYPQISEQELNLLFFNDSLMTIPYSFCDTLYYSDKIDTIQAIIYTKNNFAPSNPFENCKRHYFFTGETYVKFSNNKFILNADLYLTKNTSCENAIISTDIYVVDTSNNIINSHLFSTECNVQNSNFATQIDTFNGNGIQNYVFYFHPNDSICKIKAFAYSTKKGFLYFTTINNDSLILINQ